MAKENPELANRWRKHIEALNSSKLSRRVYCEKNGLKVSTLDYWRQRFGSTKEKAKKDRGGWIPIQIQDEKGSGIDLRIEKITVIVKPGFDPALLKDVLRILGAQC
jgi:hypothetical protein